MPAQEQLRQKEPAQEQLRQKPESAAPENKTLIKIAQGAIATSATAMIASIIYTLHESNNHSLAIKAIGQLFKNSKEKLNIREQVLINKLKKIYITCGRISIISTLVAIGCMLHNKINTGSTSF
jgi:hypothetical protein